LPAPAAAGFRGVLTPSRESRRQPWTSWVRHSRGRGFTACAEFSSYAFVHPVIRRIALEAAEMLGVNPDTFGLDLPGRQAWERVEL